MDGDVGAAVEASRWPDALARALTAWRASREPLLGDLVDVLAELAIGDAVTAQARALRTAPSSDPNRHPDNPARWYGFQERLAVLAASPADPRLGLALAGLVGRPPPWLETRAWFALCDERLGEQLVAHADRRAIGVLARATARVEARARVMPWIDAIERATDNYPRTANRKMLVGWLAAAKRGRDAARSHLRLLHAAVDADPDDLAAREVYADALLERDDPRGELLALTLAHGRGQALSLAEHQRMEDLRAELALRRP